MSLFLVNMGEGGNRISALPVLSAELLLLHWLTLSEG